MGARRIVDNTSAAIDLKLDAEGYDPPPPPIFTDPPPQPPPEGLRGWEPGVDWRAEAEEAARRDAAEKAKQAAAESDKLEEPPQPGYPAGKQAKAKKTPRLDEVKSWLGQKP